MPGAADPKADGPKVTPSRAPPDATTLRPDARTGTRTGQAAADRTKRHPKPADEATSAPPR